MLQKILLLAVLLLQDRGAPPLPPPPGTAAPQGFQGNSVVQLPQQLPPGTATLDGSVTIAGGTEPLSGVVVEMRKADCGKGGGESMTATTGIDGKFSFKQIRSGTWCIGAAKAGGLFSPVEYQQRGTKSRGIAVPIADNQQIHDIKLAMPRTGSISGRVFDFNGEPMGHARVEVMEAFYESGQKRLYTLNAVQTNDLGEFSLFWLPPGEYFVSAVPEDPLRQSVVFSISPPGLGGHRSDAMPPVVSRRNLDDGTFIEEVYAPVYFGGGTDPQRAQKIDVAPDRASLLNSPLPVHAHGRFTFAGVSSMARRRFRRKALKSDCIQGPGLRQPSFLMGDPVRTATSILEESLRDPMHSLRRHRHPIPMLPIRKLYRRSLPIRFNCSSLRE
jgi:hypothetical protein